MTRALPVTLAALTVCGGGLAQDAADRPEPRSATVAVAAAGERVTFGRPPKRALAAMPGGELFVFVDRIEGDEHRLELHASTDGGLHWARLAEAPTPQARDGTMLVDGDRLFCAWAGQGSKQFASAFVQHFDPVARAFVGEPVELAVGTGAEDQYSPQDVERTDAGVLVLAVGSHRRPPAPWTTGRSTGLYLLRPESSEWDGPHQVNVASFGVWGDIQAVGEVVHSSYRTISQEPFIASRAFDVATGKFTTAIDRRVSAEGESISNSAITCVDGRGGVYVVFVRGDRIPGRGVVRIGYARPGSDEFNAVDLFADPDLFAGNENPASFSLARGPGDEVTAVYSKRSEQNAHLYTRLLADGQPMGRERRVVAGEAGRFETVSGIRSTQFETGVVALTTGWSDHVRNRRIEVFGLLPARVTSLRAH